MAELLRGDWTADGVRFLAHQAMEQPAMCGREGDGHQQGQGERFRQRTKRQAVEAGDRGRRGEDGEPQDQPDGP